MKQLAIFLVLSISFSIRAQEFEKDFNAIVSKMDTSAAISIDVKVSLYSKKGGAIVYSTVSSIDHSKTATITHLGEMEIYKSSAYEVQVDHEEKRMMIHKESGKQEDFSDLNMKEIKKLLKMAGEADEPKQPKYTLVSNQNGIKTYLIKNIEGFKEFQIVLDTKGEKLQRMTYEYTEGGPNKGQYCVLEYQKFDYSPTFKSSFFDTKNYFTYVNKSYVAAKKLSTYKLILE